MSVWGILCRYTLPCTLPSWQANILAATVKLSPIKVNDQETGRIHFAECCHPIPGDAIRALLVKDKGMIIHRDTCQTLVKADPEEQLDAGWDSFAQSNVPHHPQR